MFGEAGGAGGGGGADVHDVGNAPLVLVGGNLGDTAVFGVVQEDTFSRAAGHPETVYTGLDVELHYLAKGVLVERPSAVMGVIMAGKIPLKLFM